MLFQRSRTWLLALSLSAVFALSVPTLTLAQSNSSAQRIAVFVGPQMRDGFVDTDAGVRDSIQDVQKYLRETNYFSIAPNPDAATMVLYVVARRSPGTAGGVGVPIGAVSIYVPIRSRAIDTVLHVGTYQRTFTSQSGDDSDTWRRAAKNVAEDLAVWYQANRDMMATVVAETRVNARRDALNGAVVLPGRATGIEAATKRKTPQRDVSSPAHLLQGQTWSSIRTLKKKAALGGGGAQLALGAAYEIGFGVPQDTSQAAVWYRRAAEQGELLAQSALGALYFGGQGIPKDETQAALWIRKAATRGLAEAQSNLALLEGGDVP